MLKTKKLSNNGFSHIEMFIVLVVIAAVSFIGYHVYTKSTAHAGSQLLGSISTLHDGTFNITASCKTLAPSTNATTYTFTATASETNPNISYGYDGGASSFFISTQRDAKNVLTNGYTKTSPYPYSTNPDIKVNYNNPAVVIAGTADSISTPKNDWGYDGRVSSKNITIDTKLYPVIYFGTSYSNAFAKPVIRDEFSWLNQSGIAVASIPTCASPTPPPPPVHKVTPPSTPKNILITPMPGAFKVSWTASDGALRYKVEAVSGSNVSTCMTGGANDDNCILYNLLPNLMYVVTVTASNSKGSSSSLPIKETSLSLVNSNGLRPYNSSQVILGVSTPYTLTLKDGSTGSVDAHLIGQNIHSFSSSIGLNNEQPKIFNFYGCGNRVGYKFSDITNSLSSVNSNIIPMYSFVVPFTASYPANQAKKSTNKSNWNACAQYSKGYNPNNYDDSMNIYVSDVAKQVRAYGKPAFIRLNWEFNSNWTNHYSFLSPEKFKSAWTKYAGLIKNIAPNAVIVWCPNDSGSLFYDYINGTDSTSVFPGRSAKITDYYPSDYVDWTCSDAYPYQDDNKFPNHVDPNLSNSINVLNYLAKFSHAKDKPMMLGEWSVETNPPNDGKAVVNSIFKWQNSNSGTVQANLWFDYPKNLTDRSDLLIADDTAASNTFSNEIKSNSNRYILADQ